jgi:hypothetical protein
MTNRLIQMIKNIIIENDNILNVRGGRGYGVGHPYAVRQIKPVLGDSHYNQHDEKDEENDNGKVKISKAFKRN